MATAQLITSRGSVVKWIEIKQPTPTSPSRFVKLGFTNKTADNIGNLVADLNLAIDGGRCSSISSQKAQEYREALSTEFNIPVDIVERTILGAYDTQDRFFNVNSITGKQELKPGINRDQVYEPEALQIKDAIHARALIAYCEKELKIISDSDRASLNPYIKALEKSLKEQEALRTEITPAQKDVLKAIAEPYIDDIIDACADINSGTDLVGDASRWLSAEDAFMSNSKRDIALAVLLQSFQSYIGTVYYEQVCGLKEQVDSAEELNSIYYGDRKHSLETALLQLGSFIPDIKMRRLFLFEMIQKKLDEKFGADPITDVEGFSRPLINGMLAQLFVEGCNLKAIWSVFASDPSNKSKLMITPLNITLLALQGKLGTQERLLEWDSEDFADDSLTKEQRQAKIDAKVALLRAQVEKSLALTSIRQDLSSTNPL